MSTINASISAFNVNTNLIKHKLADQNNAGLMSAADYNFLHTLKNPVNGNFVIPDEIKDLGDIRTRLTDLETKHNADMNQLSSKYVPINASANHIHTNLSNTDTKNTTGSSNSVLKLYLVGATSQSATGAVTYSNTNLYAQNGYLYTRNGQVISQNDLSDYITRDASANHTHSQYVTTDTKNTVGSSNSTSKLYIIGAAAQSTTTGSYTSYSNRNVYIQSNTLYSNNKAVAVQDDVDTLADKVDELATIVENVGSTTDTKDTTRTVNNSITKLFLVGAATQAAYAQTNTDSYVYMQGAALYVNDSKCVTYDVSNKHKHSKADITDFPTFKTINGNTITGTGNITIQAGNSGLTEIPEEITIKVAHFETYTNVADIGKLQSSKTPVVFACGNILNLSGEALYLNSSTYICSQLQLNSWPPVQGVSIDNVYAYLVDVSSKATASLVNTNNLQLQIDKIDATIGKANGIASLDSTGKLTTAQIPTLKTINSNSILGSGNISTPDTKNTAGSSNSTSKLYLIGGTTQNSAGVTTYSNSNAYVQAGVLYSDGKQVATIEDTEKYQYISNITSGSLTITIPSILLTLDTNAALRVTLYDMSYGYVGEIFNVFICTPNKITLQDGTLTGTRQISLAIYDDQFYPMNIQINSTYKSISITSGSGVDITGVAGVRCALAQWMIL